MNHLRRENDLALGGFVPFSLVDYPGKMAAVVFTQGCRWRCGYCHNRALLPRLTETRTPMETVRAYLRERRGDLDGVVVTGGEPTLQKGLRAFLDEVKAMGLAVKLDTNGSDPETLGGLLEARLVDYVAMDLKERWERYTAVVGVPVVAEDLQESVRLVESAPDGELRTTVLPGVHTPVGVRAMLAEACVVAGKGRLRRFALQPFVASGNVLAQEWRRAKETTPEELRELRTVAEAFADEVVVRM